MQQELQTALAVSLAIVIFIFFCLSLFLFFKGNRIQTCVCVFFLWLFANCVQERSVYN